MQTNQDVATLASSVPDAYRLPMSVSRGSPSFESARSVYEVLGRRNKFSVSLARYAHQLAPFGTLADLVEMGGFEPPTSRVQGGRSPTELHPRRSRTGS